MKHQLRLMICLVAVTACGIAALTYRSCNRRRIAMSLGFAHTLESMLSEDPRFSGLAVTPSTLNSVDISGGLATTNLFADLEALVRGMQPPVRAVARLYVGTEREIPLNHGKGATWVVDP